ncbi:hypothetical protein WME75_26270 [Sorangium sp. So ce1014]
MAGWADEGRIRTTRREHFGRISAANLRAAHARIESEQAVGKRVLEGWD